MNDSAADNYSHCKCWIDQNDAETDRSVLWNGESIGRVRYDAVVASGPRWVWSCHFNAIVHDQTGQAETRDDALEAVRARHEREGCPGPYRSPGLDWRNEQIASGKLTTFLYWPS